MIHFIVDSTFGVEEEYKKAHNIKVAGLSVMLDDKIYHDENLQEWQLYYEALKKSKNFPKTTQPSPETFVNLIEQTLQQDPDAKILLLTITQTLSGTYNCAKMVAENYKDKVFVIDTESATTASLLMLEELVDGAENGMELNKLLKLAEELKNKVSVRFVPSTMEYLRRGGRISLIKSVVANLLNIKPVILHKKALLTIHKKCLGAKKAITEMLTELKDKVKRAYIVYVHESPLLNEIIGNAKEIFNVTFKKQSVSPVIGSHIGIGAVGIACLEK